MRAWALEDRPLTELLETAPLTLDEPAIARQPPPNLQFAPLPASFGADSARVLERVLKDRLPDKLARDHLVRPGHEEVVGARRGRGPRSRRACSGAAAGPHGGEAAGAAGEGAARRLAAAEQSLSGRRAEKWTAIGSAVLSNIGLFGGRKRTISGAGTVVTKNRMENAAEARVAQLRAEVAELEAQAGARWRTLPADRFEQRMLEPVRSDLSILRYRPRLGLLTRNSCAGAAYLP